MELAVNELVKKYPAYKDSGVEWLGEIPEHWVCLRMKYLFSDISIKGKPDAELLSVTQDKGVVPRTWVENRMVMPSGNLESFKFIRQGDFAISLRSFEGGLEYCHHDGIISPAYTVLQSQKLINDHYYKYLFKSYSFISELQTSVVGIREGKNISYPELSYSILPIPPLPEQTTIAAFLDRKTALIDKAIAIKEKQIELLKERREILIQNAVTKGLNPNVKMKDSGVEWIGEIPEHWEVKKIKYVLSLSKEKAPTKDSEKTYIGMENIESHTGRYIETNSEVEGLANRFEKEDILFGKLRPYLAKVHLAQFDGLCSTEFLVFRCRNPYYYQKLMLSNQFINLVDSSTYGAKMPRASSDWIGNQPIPIPTMVEQEEIVKHLSAINNNISKIIDVIEFQIEKLKEYKTTLINSAVTGKIKVSEP